MRTRQVLGWACLGLVLASLASGPASAATGPVLGPPVTVTDLVPVPQHPRAYFGPQRLTTALDRSFDGTAAIRVGELPPGADLQPGQAVALSDAALFAFDSPVLTRGARRDIAALARHLSGARRVRCEGFTDYAGLRAHELVLGRQRAVNVCAALASRAVGLHTRIAGYGPAHPAVIGGTAPSRTQNRRVVVVVTG